MVVAVLVIVVVVLVEAVALFVSYALVVSLVEPRNLG